MYTNVKTPPFGGCAESGTATFEKTVTITLKESQRAALVANLEAQTFCPTQEMAEITHIIKDS